MLLKRSDGVSDTILAALVAVLWFGATAALMTNWTVPNARLAPYGQVFGLLFILVFIAWLWRTAPSLSGTPSMQRIGFPRFGFYPILILIVGAFLLLFVISFAAHPQLIIVTFLTLVSASLIVLHQRAVTGRSILVGLGLAAICILLSCLSGRLNSYTAFYLGCIAVLFVGGTILAAATGLARVESASGSGGRAVVGFLGGCLLAFPAALLNVSLGAHSGDAWIDQAWEPLVALVPGIAEETWARLFLLTLLFAVLHPSSAHRPKRALFVAVLLAALVHGLAHLPTALVFGPAALQMGLAALLFGVPMGLIYVRFGFEWTVGYHFFVDFVRFGVALQAQTP